MMKRPQVSPLMMEAFNRHVGGSNSLAYEPKIEFAEGSAVAWSTASTPDIIRVDVRRRDGSGTTFPYATIICIGPERWLVPKPYGLTAKLYMSAKAALADTAGSVEGYEPAAEMYIPAPTVPKVCRPRGYAYTSAGKPKTPELKRVSARLDVDALWG